MDKVKNGGPAFPLEIPGGNGHGPITYFGMTLRDYFAAKAFAMLMHPEAKYMAQEETATLAYRFSDAMLKAREQA